MDCNNYSNIVSKTINRKISLLDRNNILWKCVNDKWIGKRSVWTKDWRVCWLEDSSIDNVKSWWCGENADYTEVFNWLVYGK